MLVTCKTRTYHGQTRMTHSCLISNTIKGLINYSIICLYQIHSLGFSVSWIKGKMYKLANNMEQRPFWECCSCSDGQESPLFCEPKSLLQCSQESLRGFCHESVDSIRYPHSLFPWNPFLTPLYPCLHLASCFFLWHTPVRVLYAFLIFINLCSSFRLKDPCKTTRKMIDLYILIFRFLDRKWAYIN